MLEVARLQARARRLKVRARLIRTRNPGKAIVQEAIERHSDLIYISTDHAPSDERLLGPTTRYVLANRPCRVVVEGGNAPAEANAVAPTDGRRQPAGRHTAAGERSARSCSRTCSAPRARPATRARRARCGEAPRPSPS